ncbi:MAG TPA: hypothetical protein VFV60_01765 [bacterium]|nr:hypothetical protein [bacterium]
MSLWWTHAFVASENAGKPLDHECPDGYYRMHEDGMCRIVRTDGKDRTAPREQEAEGEACPHGGTVWAGSTDCPKCAPEGS